MKLICLNCNGYNVSSRDIMKYQFTIHVNCRYWPLGRARDMILILLNNNDCSLEKRLITM